MLKKAYLMLVFVEALDLIEDLPLTELSLLDCLSRPLKSWLKCVCMRFVTNILCTYPFCKLTNLQIFF